MNTPTFTLRAKRIVSVSVDDGYVLAAFEPGPLTVKEFETLDGKLAIIDLEDETGMWGNGRTFEVADVTVSEDMQAMTLRLLS